MSKKLLGERQIGDAVYTAGQIITDEEFAKSGLAAADVVTVNSAAPEAAAAQETPAAPADKDAVLDASAQEVKQSEEQSSQAGSTSSEGGASTAETAKEGEELSIAHVLTEQDLIDNPDLTAQGLKVGDEVRIPAVEKIIDEQMLADDASLTERGLTVGDKVLVAKE